MVCLSLVHLLSLSAKEDISCGTFFGGYLFLQLTWMWKLLGAYQIFLFFARNIS